MHFIQGCPCLILTYCIYPGQKRKGMLAASNGDLVLALNLGKSIHFFSHTVHEPMK